MKLLLINPKFPESFWSFKWAVESILSNKKTVNPPLGLATLAALCPENWEVEIVDENVESLPSEPEADLIGICGMGVQFERQKELIALYKNKGYFVVTGGSYVSLCPELYETLSDTVVAGEAEYIWKEFCRDFEQGRPKKLYHEKGVVSLTDSPVPRYDLLKLEKYQAVSLQFSRGCPYLCEFCDIIVMFGRKPRTKSLEQIGKELDLLRELGISNAFFIDDNLIGNKRAAKDLLRYIRDYQKEHNYQFHFGTEASLNIAYDDELLELFHAASFEWVFIGIESPDEDSLKEARKFQNAQEDILTSVKKIYAAGIDILAGFIVGFDNDTLETFDRQYRFIMESGIQAAMVGLLTALPKTPLYERLGKEGRLIQNVNNIDNTKLGTNVIPKLMNYDKMVSSYRELHYRLLDDRSIADRIINKVSYFKVSVYNGKYSTREKLSVLSKFTFRGLLPGGASRLFHFVRSIPFSKPSLLPMVVEDWVTGLAMRDYIDRHFSLELKQGSSLTQNYLKSIKKAFHLDLSKGSLDISLDEVKNAAANLSISMKGWLDKDFFLQAGDHLEKMLKHTTSSLTLHIKEFHESQTHNLKELLNRLSQYGDRVSITVDEKLKGIIDIDSSLFNLAPAR